MKTSTEYSKKQRLIYHYLTTILSDEATLEAMLVWQDKYATKPGFSVRYFADDISKLSGGTYKPKEIMLNLVSAMTQNAEMLADPSEKIERYRLNEGRYFASTKSQHVDAFNLLVNKLFTVVGSETTAQLKRHIAQGYLRKADISHALKAHLVNGAKEASFELKMSDAPIKDLKSVINGFYIILCELVGPNQADATFSEALRRLEQNGGAQFSSVFKQIM